MNYNDSYNTPELKKTQQQQKGAYNPQLGTSSGLLKHKVKEKSIRTRRVFNQARSTTKQIKTPPKITPARHQTSQKAIRVDVDPLLGNVQHKHCLVLIKLRGFTGAAGRLKHIISLPTVRLV